jgi:hypothetical protein
MSMPVMRVVVRVAASLGCTLGCAAAHPGPLTVTPGCYALYADNWPPAVEAETGLHSLPAYLALDTVLAGPRGRRVILPTTWEPADPNSRSVYWTEEAGHGSGGASLVLTFLGPAGDFVATLQPSRYGYSGEGVGLGRRGAGRMPQVQVSLVATTCAGLLPARHDSAP